MKVYVVDEQLNYPHDLNKMNDGTARDWNIILNSNAIIIVMDEDGNFSRLTEHGKESLNLLNGVVVLHRPSPSVIDAIESEITSGKKLFAVHISGSPYDGPDSESKWYYRVHTAVNSPNDPDFSTRFKSFIDDLNKAVGIIPNFKLLEPNNIPEPLLSYALAIHYKLESPFIASLIDNIDIEYNKIRPNLKLLLTSGKDVSYADIELPNISDFGNDSYDVSSIRYKAVCNVIDLLREDA